VDITSIMLVLALASASALCGVAIWALREVVETARSVRLLSEDTRERLVPLLDKTDVTVDAVNAELWRIDGVITRFEEASERVGKASNAINDIVNAPADIVTDVADKVRRAWRDRRVTKPAEDSEAQEVTHVQASEEE
jgi:ABC-type transporter Mla subunit MlaD